MLNQEKVHKKQTHISELAFYLEELYQMDMLDEKEEVIYMRHRDDLKVSKSDWKYVLKRMNEYTYEKF